MIKRKVLVIGAGISGRAAITYLEEKGFAVTVVDKKSSAAVLADTTIFSPFDFDFVVVSPGIPKSHPLYKTAIEKGIEVVGEMELALRELPNRMIGITGSNGKSTTVSTVAHILQECGYKARAVGNIGIPLLSLVGEVDPDEILVLEISSFQLETMYARKLEIGAILNITPNHLDWHSDMEDYRRAKYRIRELVKEGGAFYDGLLDNRAYVRKITVHFGIREELFEKALHSFKGLPHRMEYVCEIEGISCYNDSKATTPEAVSYAVERLEKNIILIAGGKNKGCSFSSWSDSFRGKVKALILFGASKDVIEREVKIEAPVLVVNSLEEAVEKGLQCASIGDNLLLSPGCASYDMFENFEKRGEAYKQLLCERKHDKKRYDHHCSSD
jgi:UDP-N-acetylmuramoylalanine--D-glutamate ligase